MSPGCAPLRGDVEAHVEVPDFAPVAERGRQVRRRRAVVASAAVAVAVAVVTARRRAHLRPRPDPGARAAAGPERSTARQPCGCSPTRTRRSTPTPRRWTAPATCSRSSRCPVAATTAERRTAPRCGGPAPTEAAAPGWSGGGPSCPSRTVSSSGSVPPACRSGAPAETRAYLVDGSGAAHGIAWEPRCGGACARTGPRDPRCRFDVGRATGSLDPGVRLPAGHRARRDRAGRRPVGPVRRRPPAVLVDRRQVVAEPDHLAPRGSIVSATAAGPWGCSPGTPRWSTPPTRAAAWHSRDLSSALSRRDDRGRRLDRHPVRRAPRRHPARGAWRRPVPQHRRVLDALRRDGRAARRSAWSARRCRATRSTSSTTSGGPSPPTTARPGDARRPFRDPR